MFWMNELINGNTDFHAFADHIEAKAFTLRYAIGFPNLNPSPEPPLHTLYSRWIYKPGASVTQQWTVKSLVWDGTDPYLHAPTAQPRAAIGGGMYYVDSEGITDLEKAKTPKPTYLYEATVKGDKGLTEHAIVGYNIRDALFNAREFDVNHVINVTLKGEV